MLSKIWKKLVLVDDTPQKVAAGFGLGVFAGVMPFAGPVVAVFLAYLFHVNKAAAFLGGLFTNTWISWLVLILSVKVGSFMLGADCANIVKSWTHLIKHFHWQELFKLSALEIILPTALGYLVLSLFAALVAYGASYAAIIAMKKVREEIKR